MFLDSERKLENMGATCNLLLERLKLELNQKPSYSEGMTGFTLVLLFSGAFFCTNNTTNSVLPIFSVHVTAKGSQWQEWRGAVWGVVLLQETGYIEAKIIRTRKVVGVGANPSNYLKKERGMWWDGQKINL